MKRLTKDNPQENFETMLNYVFGKDGWAHILHDGENGDVPLTEWAKEQCLNRDCTYMKGLTIAKEIDDTLCDCLMDGDGCPVALAYCFACQASHLRDRLKAIEDILGDEYDLDHLRELAQAEKAGRLVVLPEVPEADRRAFVDGLHDYFQEAANYDPSVGIFGMREGEAELAGALMDALNRQEAKDGSQ